MFEGAQFAGPDAEGFAEGEGAAWVVAWTEEGAVVRKSYVNLIPTPNGGTHDGKRVLSEAAVKEMTKRQTPETLKESYGLGWSVGGDSFGHGGAFATNMNVDTKRGLITVFLVQHAGFPGEGVIALRTSHRISLRVAHVDRPSRPPSGIASRALMMRATKTWTIASSSTAICGRPGSN